MYLKTDSYKDKPQKFRAYFWQALRISIPEYFKIFLILVLICMILGLLGLGAGYPFLSLLSLGLASLGLVWFLVSLVGLYRFYGPPALHYYARILQVAKLSEPLQWADLHMGNYRHTLSVQKLLPQININSVDCWEESDALTEADLQKLRSLEIKPAASDHLSLTASCEGKLPLADKSLDVVSIGIGFHEFTKPVRQMLLKEASRVLRPEGKILLFEHVKSIWNFFIFGRLIFHWPKRQAWIQELSEFFANIKYQNITSSVDLFIGQVR